MFAWVFGEVRFDVYSQVIESVCAGVGIKVDVYRGRGGGGARWCGRRVGVLVINRGPGYGFNILEHTGM